MGSAKGMKRQTPKGDDKWSTKKQKNNHGGSSSSQQHQQELSGSAQKRQLKKERQSYRRHSDVVAEAKDLWNKLRLKSNSSKDTKELVNKIMSLVRGKVREVALQHDASRVVQALIQFGTPKQRKELLVEICNTTNTTDNNNDDKDSSSDNLVELAKIQYAHFCCLKFIKYCSRDDEAVKLIVKSFKGSMSKLAVHSVGARVVESLFINLPSKATSVLKLEFYGPHFSLFGNATTTATTTNGGKNKNNSNNTASNNPTLSSVLQTKATTTAQMESAIKFVKEIITKGITKSFFGYSYFQQLLVEYMDVHTPIQHQKNDKKNDNGGGSIDVSTTKDSSELRSIISSVSDHTIHLLSTKSGSKVASICASYGTSRDRKKICKSLKGYTKSSLLHRDAYLPLLRLVQVTDDTVSINKSILHEIVHAPTSTTSTTADASKEDEEGDGSKKQSPLLELALSETASKLFLMILVQQQQQNDDENESDTTKNNNSVIMNNNGMRKYFDPYERSILGYWPYVIEKKNEMIPTCKKDPNQRRKELLKYVDDALFDLCITHTDTLMRSIAGSRIVREYYCCVMKDDSNTEEEREEKLQQLINALVDAVETSMDMNGDDNDDDENDDKDKKVSLFEHPVGHRTLKSLILSDCNGKIDNNKNDDDDDDTNGDDDAISFSKVLAARLLDGNDDGNKKNKKENRILDIIQSNRGAFVMESLLQNRTVHAKLMKQLKSIQSTIKGYIDKKYDDGRGRPTLGYQALLKAIK